MIVVSLLLFLAGVALLAAGLVSENILLEVGSIAAASLAALALYVGVRRRGPVVTEQPEPTTPPQNFTPLKSTWSAPTAEEPVLAPAANGAGWLMASEQNAAATKRGQGGERDPVQAREPAAEPDEEAVTDADARRVAALSADVLVVDGRPRYHLLMCPALSEDETVPLPVSEARDAGFTPCARCQPDAHILGNTWRSGSAR